VEVVIRQSELFQIVGALHSSCGFASGRNGGKKDPNEHSDDCDNDKKFDKSEGGGAFIRDA
jgi:hypothetical protein